jgi:hypothetical protein
MFEPTKISDAFITESRLDELQTNVDAFRYLKEEK